jgi:hypothetical protein
MRNRFTNLKFSGAIIAIAALFAVMPTNAAAQNAPPANQPRVTPQPNPGNGAQAGRGRGAAAPEPPSAPAPVRDFNGMWAGGMEALISNRISPMTPAGKAKLDGNIPDPFSASSNDPWKTCDPFGMPRSVNNQTGQLGFATMPGRIILMSGFNRTWREIWMDGRKPPANIGHEGAPSAMYNGYSVGHWEGDSTLVVETVGMDEKTWNDRRGYPHSVDAKVTERYTRTDHDHLSVTETIEDPAYYTAPVLWAKNDFRWVKGQDDPNASIPFTNEQLCIPSQAIEYLNLIGTPADIDGATGQNKNNNKKK